MRALYLGLVVVFAAQASAAATVEVEQLRAELEAMKVERARQDEQMRLLEERLRALETKASVPPAAVAGASQEFQADTESREQALLTAEHPYAGRVQEVLQGFMDIHGYFRAGYGRNSSGGSMVGFQAPGALAKYRLGNEPDTYGEITFGKNFYDESAFRIDAASGEIAAGSGPVGRFQTTLAAYTPIQDAANSGSANFSFAEIWGSVGNVIASQPSLKFWAGNRYYRRHDIHLNDFFFSNMSGTGGGFEDLKLGIGKLAFAWIGQPGSSGVTTAPEPDAANKAGFSKTSFDLRLYDMNVPGGSGEAGLVFSRATSGLDSNGIQAPTSTGFSGMFIHTRKGVFSDDGVNKASIQFGTGAAMTLNSGFETFSLDGQTFIRPADHDAWRLRVTENFTANLNDSFSIGPVLIYQLTDYAGTEGKMQWLSA
ncbi:MAG TPA: carbohydrate porin, partial [Steroidobacteraceae bacterium]|nr:carbohydrate porin [Steroidobacteraceae bacterium]